MATTFDENFDYLSLLGLDPGAVRMHGVEGIRDAVKRKKKEWTAQAINPLYQQMARTNLERIRHFEQILRDPAALEAYLGFLQQVQAVNREQQELEVGKLIRLAVGDQHRELTQAQVDLLKAEAEARGIPAETVERTMQLLGLSIGAAAGPAATSTLPYKQPAMDRTLLMQISKHLQVLDKGSFYELLDLPFTSSPARMESVARLLHAKWSKALPKTNECVAWEKSLQACMTYLKDDEGKERYDRALYNENLDKFLWRVDLILAGGKFSREKHVTLARIGVEDFGLNQTIVNQCLQLRAATKGVPLSKPVVVSVKMEGQTTCKRCFRWNAAGAENCVHCGNSLLQICLNPACGRPVSVAAKVCDACHLPVSRGRQYAALMSLMDALVRTGNVKPLLEACGVARQILPSPVIDKRTAEAARIRELITSVKHAAGKKRWSAAEQSLSELLRISPDVSTSGLPQLESVVQFQTQMRDRLGKLSDAVEPRAAAEVYLAILSQWTDCAEVIAGATAVARRLETREQYDVALKLYEQLLVADPRNEAFKAHCERLGQTVADAQAQATRRDQALKAWSQALLAQRLYGAERALQTLQELDATDIVRDDVEKLAGKLVEIRAEVQAIRQIPAGEISQDARIGRYLSILDRCPDCREALAALQSISPDPPPAPADVQLSLNGNRRMLSWAAPRGEKQPSFYVVQRALARPHGRHAEHPFTTVYEGPDLHFIDEEVAHNGSVIRYSVHAVLEGRLEVGAHLLRDYSVSSEPVSTEPLLIWQEVLGLRATRTAQGLELKWHQPAGTRQVVVERWPGGKADRPAEPTIVSASAEARLSDMPPAEAPLYTYRLYCVYDGPQGDFATPGVCVLHTVVPQDSPPDAVPIAGGPAEALSAEGDSEEAKSDRGPLKRFGLWPPVQG